MFSLFGSGCSVRYLWINSRASSAENLQKFVLTNEEISSKYHDLLKLSSEAHYPTNTTSTYVNGRIGSWPTA